jgi:hypothetical protein
VQLADLDDLDATGEGDADFLVEFEPPKGKAPPDPGRRRHGSSRDARASAAEGLHRLDARSAAGRQPCRDDGDGDLEGGGGDEAPRVRGAYRVAETLQSAGVATRCAAWPVLYRRQRRRRVVRMVRWAGECDFSHLAREQDRACRPIMTAVETERGRLRALYDHEP